MADRAGDEDRTETCLACGRVLPARLGRGRRRRYCDARCRDAARRERVRAARRAAGDVKEGLTKGRRQEYLDTIEKDSVAGRAAAAAQRLIEEFGRGGAGQAAGAGARGPAGGGGGGP